MTFQRPSQDAYFGDWLFYFMQEADLRNKDLANALEIAPSTVSKWINHVTKPAPMSRVDTLARLLKIRNPADVELFFAKAGYPFRPQITDVINTGLLDAPPTGLSAFPSTAPTPTSLGVGSRILFHPNPYFVGRATILHKIEEALNQMQSKPPVIVVSGIGGIGKTQLVAEVVHQYGASFEGGVFWMNFSEAREVPNEIASCNGGGLFGIRPDFHTLPLEEQVTVVYKSWHSDVPRLLIFDGCEEEALLAHWCPKSGASRVLVTSRRSTWSGTLGVQVFPLQALERTESVALLTSYRPDLAGTKEVEDIATQLGNLPLALHLAGSFLNTVKLSAHVGDPRRYLEQLKSINVLDHVSMKGKGAEYSPTQHEQNIERTFALSYERLDPSDPVSVAAQALLARAGCFAPGDPIPHELLMATLELPEVETLWVDAEEALAKLLALGLITKIHESALVLHPLLTLFVITRLGGPTIQELVEKHLMHKAKAINGAGDPAPLRQWQSHLRHVTDGACERNSHHMGALAHEFGVYLDRIGNYQEASVYLLKALAWYQQERGFSHEETLRTLQSLGMLRYHQGQYEESKRYLEEVLALQAQLFGATDPQTIQSANDLGLLLAFYGDTETTSDYLSHTLDIAEQTCGRTHPHTAQSLNNIGVFLYQQGKLDEAVLPLEQSLYIRELTLHKSHPHIAASLNNLGALFDKLGDVTKALPYYQKALSITEERLGHEHPETAQSLNNLGILLLKSNNWEAAQSCLQEALVIREHTLGPQHPHTASSLNNLGTLFESLGNLSEAQNYYQRALAIFDLFPERYERERRLVHGNIVVLSYKQGHRGKPKYP